MSLLEGRPLQAIAGIAFVSLVSCSWVVGIRLLLLAKRTRALPETCLGWMIVCLMGIGYPLAVGAQAESSLGLPLAKFFQALSNGFIDLGFALTPVFTWKVFRRDSSWARTFVAFAFVALLGHWIITTHVLIGLESISQAVTANRYWATIAIATGFLANCWSAFECLRYRALLQRRLALGLGDPVVSNRFLLWGSMGVISSIGLLVNTYFMFAGIDVLTAPMAQSVVSLIGITQASLLYLTFLAPTRYTQWLLAEQPGCDS